MRSFVFVMLALAALLAGCQKEPEPTADKYYVNGGNGACTVDKTAGLDMLAGPFDTADEAKAAKTANGACNPTAPKPAPAP